MCVKGNKGVLMVGFLVGAIGAFVAFKLRKHHVSNPQSLSKKADRKLQELEARLGAIADPA